MKKLLLSSGFLIFIFSFMAAADASAQARKAVGGAEATGTFREAASGSVFKILALGKGKLRVAFSGVYPYKTASGEMSANMGEASGEAAISGDAATFKPADFEQCTITLKFLTRGRLKVTQKGTDAECGFGNNVSADGNYKKISARRPKF
jgi:hypothetical protein